MNRKINYDPISKDKQVIHENNIQGRPGIYQAVLHEFISFLRFSFGSLLTAEFLKVAIPLLILWEIVPQSGIIPRNLVPALSDVVNAFFNLLLYKNLLGHIFYSMTAFIPGIFFAVITAVPLGIAVGWNLYIRKHFLPLFQLLAPIPPTAWAPLTIIIFGVGLPMKIFLIFLGVFYPVFLNTYQAVKDTDPRFLSSARVAGASELTIITRIFFWDALGAILISIKTGIAMGLVMMTSAEMYGGIGGIGFLLAEAKDYFQISVMEACMILLGATGWFLIEILKYIELKLSIWKEVRVKE